MHRSNVCLLRYRHLLDLITPASPWPEAYSRQPSKGVHEAAALLFTSLQFDVPSEPKGPSIAGPIA